MVEGEFPRERLEELVPVMQAATAGQGTASAVGRTLTWSSRTESNTSAQQVLVTVRDGQTLIRVEESFGGLAGGLFGGIMGGVGGGVGVGMGGALAGALGSVALAVAFPVGIGLALVVGVFVNYWADPVGNPYLLFAGVALVAVAIMAAGCGQEPQEPFGGRWSRRPRS